MLKFIYQQEISAFATQKLCQHCYVSHILWSLCRSYVVIRMEARFHVSVLIIALVFMHMYNQRCTQCAICPCVYLFSDFSTNNKNLINAENCTPCMYYNNNFLILYFYFFIWLTEDMSGCTYRSNCQVHKYIDSLDTKHIHFRAQYF